MDIGTQFSEMLLFENSTSDPLLDSGNTTTGSSQLYNQVLNLFITIYYLLLIPVATVGNFLTLLVVIYIARHQKSRRSIPDLCLGILAVVDLASVFLVHPVTLGALSRRRWTYPPWVCTYQGFAASVYLKIEFIIQVLISLDRHFALVRPLKYHAFSSLLTLKLVIAGAIVFALGTTALSFSLGSIDSVVYIETWRFCMAAANFKSITDIILNSITSAVFLAGFIAFIVCNVTLVNILRHYHERRANCLLQQITDAMQAMGKEHERCLLGPNGGMSPTNKTFPEGKPHQPRKSSKSMNILNNHTNGSAHRNSFENKRKSTSESIRAINCHQSADVIPKDNGHEHSTSRSITDQCKAENGPKNKTSLANSINTAELACETLNMVSNGQNTNHSKSKSMCENHCDCSGCCSESNSPTAEKHGMSIEGRDLQLHLCKSQSIPQICIESECSQVVRCNDSHGHDQYNPSFSIDEESLVNSAASSPELHERHGLNAPEGTSQKIRKSQSFIEPQTLQTLLPVVNIHKSNSVGNKNGINNKGSRVSFAGVTASFSSGIFPSVDVEIEDRASESDNKMTTEFTNLESKEQSKPHLQEKVISTNPVQSHPSITVSPPSIINLTQINTPTKSPKPRMCSNGDKIEDPLESSTKSDRSWGTEKALYVQQQMQKFLRKMQKKARKQRRELILARLVLFCATVFLITWVPYVVITVLSFAGIHASTLITDVALKLVFLNAFLNPIFYGVCRKTYRTGYSYLLQMFLHFMCCGGVDKPGEDKVFFDSKKKRVKRHLDAAMMEEQPRRVQPEQNILDKSAHALHLLQQTLNMRPTSPGVKSQLDFLPSRRLQDLFERYLLESDTDSKSDSSSVDYDALVFNDAGVLYQNLQKVWSMCLESDDDHFVNGDVEGAEDSDIDLDVDYDELFADDFDEVFPLNSFKPTEGVDHIPMSSTTASVYKF